MKPADATAFIRQKCDLELGLHWTRHAKERLAERNLIMGDAIHVLKHGFVYDEAEAATRHDTWKYRIECVTPNSGGRTVRLVVIPFLTSRQIKIVTVMWADER
jgi:hypothetical protein